VEIDLNTVETVEYKRWIALMNGVSNIYAALRKNPNDRCLKLARSHAFNLISDIQLMLEMVEELEGKQVNGM